MTVVDEYHLDRVKAARDAGQKRITTPFGAGRLTWTPEPELICRHCGKKGDIWRTDGEDYYHGVAGACLNCGGHDCCLPVSEDERSTIPDSGEQK